MIRSLGIVNNSHASPVNAKSESENGGHDLIRARWIAAFRQHVGQGRPTSIRMLAEATGIPEPTLKSYQTEQAQPSGRNMLLIMGALGPEFVNALLEPIGMTGAHWIEGEKRPPGELLSGLCEFSALMADFLKDGVLKPQERAELRKKLPSIISMLAAHCAALEE